MAFTSVVVLKAGLKKSLAPKDLGFAGGLKIIAIGPKGGRIVGYDNKGKSIYAGSPKAKALAASLSHSQAETKVDHWLETLGIHADTTADGSAFKISVDDAKKLVAHFPALGSDVSVDSKAKKTLLPVKAALAFVGKPLVPSAADLTAHAALASGTHGEDAFFPPDLLHKLVFVKQLQSTHGVHLLKDPATGKQYVWKTNKDFGDVPSFAEEAAARIGNLVAPGMIPKAQAVAKDGIVGVLQEFHEGSEFGLHPDQSALQKHAKALAEHAVLDWLLSNHDAHGNNFMVTATGVVGFDKGQAWKFVGEDKLHPGYKPNEHQQLLSKLWKSIDSGTVKLSEADTIDAIGKMVNAVETNLVAEQLHQIVAPYLHAAEVGGQGKSASSKVKWPLIEERFKSIRTDFEAFLSERYGHPVKLPTAPAQALVAVDEQPEPLTSDAPVATPQEPVVAPVASPAAPAPAGKTVKAVPGWPVTKGTVTVHHPGVAPPAGVKWPAKYPGPGFTATVQFKPKGAKEATPWTFTFITVDGGIGVEVTLPDGAKKIAPSPNAACDYPTLWGKGMSLDTSAKEKKELKIGYSAPKFLSLPEFSAELAAAGSAPAADDHVEEKTPVTDASVVELQKQGVVSAKQETLSTHDVLKTLAPTSTPLKLLTPSEVAQIPPLPAFEAALSLASVMTSTPGKLPSGSVLLSQPKGDTGFFVLTMQLGEDAHAFAVSEDGQWTVMGKTATATKLSDSFAQQNPDAAHKPKPMVQAKTTKEVGASGMSIVDSFALPAGSALNDKLSAMPVGTAIIVNGASTNADDNLWTKTGNNTWFSASGQLGINNDFADVDVMVFGHGAPAPAAPPPPAPLPSPPATPDPAAVVKLAQKPTLPGTPLAKFPAKVQAKAKSIIENTEPNALTKFGGVWIPPPGLPIEVMVPGHEEPFHVVVEDDAGGCTVHLYAPDGTEHVGEHTFPTKAFIHALDEAGIAAPADTFAGIVDDMKQSGCFYPAGSIAADFIPELAKAKPPTQTKPVPPTLADLNNATPGSTITIEGDDSHVVKLPDGKWQLVSKAGSKIGISAADLADNEGSTLHPPAMPPPVEAVVDNTKPSASLTPATMAASVMSTVTLQQAVDSGALKAKYNLKKCELSSKGALVINAGLNTGNGAMENIALLKMILADHKISPKWPPKASIYGDESDAFVTLSAAALGSLTTITTTVAEAVAMPAPAPEPTALPKDVDSLFATKEFGPMAGSDVSAHLSTLPVGTTVIGPSGVGGWQKIDDKWWKNTVDSGQVMSGPELATGVLWASGSKKYFFGQALPAGLAPSPPPNPIDTWTTPKKAMGESVFAAAPVGTKLTSPDLSSTWMATKTSDVGPGSWSLKQATSSMTSIVSSMALAQLNQTAAMQPAPSTSPVAAPSMPAEKYALNDATKEQIDGLPSGSVIKLPGWPDTYLKQANGLWKNLTKDAASYGTTFTSSVLAGADWDVTQATPELLKEAGAATSSKPTKDQLAGMTLGTKVTIDVGLPNPAIWHKGVSDSWISQKGIVTTTEKLAIALTGIDDSAVVTVTKPAAESFPEAKPSGWEGYSGTNTAMLDALPVGAKIESDHTLDPNLYLKTADGWIDLVTSQDHSFYDSKEIATGGKDIQVKYKVVEGTVPGAPAPAPAPVEEPVVDIPKTFSFKWTGPTMKAKAANMPVGTKIVFADGYYVEKTIDAEAPSSWDLFSPSGTPQKTFPTWAQIKSVVVDKGSGSVVLPFGATPKAKVAPAAVQPATVKTPKKAQTAEQVAAQKAIADKAIKLAAFAKSNPPVGSGKVPALAHWQADVFAGAKPKVFAHEMGAGLIGLGSSDPDTHAKIVASFPGANTQTTDVGDLVVVAVSTIEGKYPAAATTVGPDGKSYPQGTTFVVQKVVKQTKHQALQAALGAIQGAKIVDHNNDNTKQMVKFKPDYLSGTDKLKAATDVVEGVGLKVAEGPIGGPVNVVVGVNKAELAEGHTFEEANVPNVPPQPPSFAPAPLPVQLSPPPAGSAGIGNAYVLANAFAAKTSPQGMAVRLGKAGVFFDNQLWFKRIKRPDGSQYIEIMADLSVVDTAKFSSNITKHGGAVSFKTQEITSKVQNGTAWEVKVFDHEDGSHIEPTTNVKEHGWSGYTGTSGNGTKVAVCTEGKPGSMANTALIRIEEGSDVMEELRLAFESIGIDGDAALKQPDEDDDRIAMKAAVVRSGLGVNGWWDKDFDEKKLDRAKYGDEKWLDQQIAKLKMEKELASAKIVTGMGGQQSVVIEDKSESKFIEEKVQFLPHGTTPQVALGMVMRGGFFSRRHGYFGGTYVGAVNAGGSPGQDDNTGGASVAAARIHTTAHGDGSYGVVGAGSEVRVCIHPRALKRTDWMLHAGDAYQSTSMDWQANDTTAFGWTGENCRDRMKTVGHGNELCFKDGVALADIACMAFKSQSECDGVIEKWKKANPGQTHINGMLPEEFFITVKTTGGAHSAKDIVAKAKGLKPGGLP